MAKEPANTGPLEEFESRPSFHLAFPVTDLDAARDFYVDVLGCSEGRSSERWMDFNFFSFQITAHLVDAVSYQSSNMVDEHDIPIPHFGLIMSWEDWHRSVDHLGYIGVDFKVPPHIRFKDQVGEQATFFVVDPSGNCLEFKAFKNPTDVFAKS